MERRYRYLRVPGVSQVCLGSGVRPLWQRRVGILCLSFLVVKKRKVRRAKPPRCPEAIHPDRGLVLLVLVSGDIIFAPTLVWATGFTACFRREDFCEPWSWASSCTKAIFGMCPLMMKSVEVPMYSPERPRLRPRLRPD